MNKSTSQPPHYTYIEVQELLGSLTKADIARLIQVYRISGCDARAGMSAEDVLAEVAQGVLAMDRAWPRSVETLPYLLETGHSVISNEEKKYARVKSTDPAEIESGVVTSLGPKSVQEGTKQSPETQIAHSQKHATLHEWIAKIRQLFADDKDATCFISHKLAELTKAAILVACKFSDQGYRTVEKRIKDKVRKKFPRGLPWWEIQ